MIHQPSTTISEAIVASLEATSAHNPNDVLKPAAILWSDRECQWRPIIPILRKLMPQLLELGEYEPEKLTGPSVWLRCAIDGALEPPVIPAEATPVVYLPGVGRQELGSAETCPDHLKPLVELQYRGTCWTQKNGKDWTVEAFLVSSAGGLGLDVARDGATRQAMLRAVAELASTEIGVLKGRRLESDDFDRLFSDDLFRDVLVWLSNANTVKSSWNSERYSAFVERCRAELGFNPEEDGELAAAERLGRQEGVWKTVWQRFAEAPTLYPLVPDLLRKAIPDNLFAEPRDSWPQNNEQDETDLRKSLQEVASMVPAAARSRIMELEGEHGARRKWVWAKLNQAPLAGALKHFAALAESTSKELGGASVADMAKLYVEGGWQADAAALISMSAVKSNADTKAVGGALRAIYRPWLESAARRFQELAGSEPLPGHRRQNQDDTRVDSGGAIVFADGLRYDVSQRLMERLRSTGRAVSISNRWAGLPTVTATAKPAVSPVSDRIDGVSLGEFFLPVESSERRALTTDRFRKLLDEAGYQYLSVDDVGDPIGRAWTEYGKLDKLGHSEQGQLAGRIDEEIDSLLERIQTLLAAGWSEVRVVTDHGWLWLPGELPKVDLPKYLTSSRWARCACVKQDSKVEVPTYPWHWNAGEYVAVGPGIACFTAGNEYAHGGVSLQECLIPVLTVTPGTGAATPGTKIASVSWVRLRCRVQIKAVQAGMYVDLRTRIADEDSSAIGGARSLDSGGAASLLVVDDELEGESAAIVVLDGAGNVLSKRATIIGGES